MSSIYCRYRIHIIDLDPSSVTSGGWLEDTSLVEKYKISDEAYNKLDGNLFEEIFLLYMTVCVLMISLCRMTHHVGTNVCRYI